MSTSPVMVGSSMPPSLLRLRSTCADLPSNHARIAHFAMLNPAEFLQLSAREIGHRCGTSEATVVRFCQRIGHKGLSAMKRVLSVELAANLPPARQLGKPAGKNETVERVFSSCLVALQDTFSYLDHAVLDQVATAVSRSELLYLFGAGGSAQIVQETALKLLSLGFPAMAFVDPMQQMAAAKLATPKDVAIAVTYSGNQKEVAEALQMARERKAFSVAITSFERSIVAKNADALLLISVPSATLRGQTGPHRVAQVALLDALAVYAARLKDGQSPAGKPQEGKRKLRKHVTLFRR
ncbi:MAG: MurR/RpiR family transcriptional regulator [Deltaproteobacteria bacterium]|nr:MurR/RpiR family transcriptional regulator [Deltaproteobacteria bacterium]